MSNQDHILPFNWQLNVREQWLLSIVPFHENKHQFSPVISNEAVTYWTHSGVTLLAVMFSSGLRPNGSSQQLQLTLFSAALSPHQLLSQDEGR